MVEGGDVWPVIEQMERERALNEMKASKDCRDENSRP